MSVNYRRCYEILELEPGASWEDLRKQYRRQAQHCHPDRFQHDPQALAQAEARLRKLNAAYKVLADYHKRHQRLPLGAASSHSDWQFQDTSALKDREAGATTKKRRAILDLPIPRWMIVAVPLTGVLLTIAFLIMHSATDEGNEPDDLLQEIPLPVARARSEKPVSAPAPLFRYGDSWKTVLSVQGDPTAMSGNTWFYGDSRVIFENGHVVSWMQSEDHPLRVAGKAPDGMAEDQAMIHLLDTEERVLSIQGPPLMRSERRWEYGPSFIEFRDGRVVRWHSSVLRPLAVDEADARLE